MDLNDDGYVDVLSGSWPGELFLFRGGPKRTFAAPIMLKDKTGKIINIGGGLRKQPDGMILIAGNAKFEQKGGKTFVMYHGKRMESTAKSPIAITGTASATHAFDWDSDGDLDILVGDIGGHVYLLPNEGTKKAYAFGKWQKLKAGGNFLRVPAGDAGPYVADWDKDGDHDLLVGAGDGSVSFFENIGTTKAPLLAAAQKLIAPSESRNSSDVPTKPYRGTRSKICVTDWNNDGHLDLLLGDFTTQKPNRPKPTPQEKAKQEKLRKELGSEEAKLRTLIPKVHGPKRVKDPDELKKITKELQQVSKRIQELRGKLPPEYENHGWVWLFLRKPTAVRTP